VSSRTCTQRRVGDADFERLDPLLEAARDASPLPAEASNVEALNAFLVRMRKERFE